LGKPFILQNRNFNCPSFGKLFLVVSILMRGVLIYVRLALLSWSIYLETIVKLSVVLVLCKVSLIIVVVMLSEASKNNEILRLRFRMTRDRIKVTVY
jgi:hypothetical protein